MKPLGPCGKTCLTVVLVLLFSCVLLAQGGGVDTTLVMAVGDSFVAGFQSGGLSIDGQRNSFPAFAARQMGAFLPLPTITRPGIPATLTIAPNGSIVPSSSTVGTLLLPPVGNSFHFNVAIPGFKVHDVLAQRPQLPDPVNRPGDILRDLILGVPGLAVPGAVTTGSEIEQVEALHPTFVIAWFGGNDVLGAFTANNVSLITPFDSFSADYLTAMKRIQAAGAKVVTANIPDVTASPLVIPAEVVAATAGATLTTIGPVLGISAGDGVYAPAIPLVTSILTGQVPGPLPRSSVLKAADAATIRAALLKENDFIKSTAGSLGIPMADFFGVLNNVKANGIVVGGRKLTANFLGGIIALDFIHPTNTGYALLGNEILKAINTGYGTNFPLVDLNAVFASDPLGPLVHKGVFDGAGENEVSIFNISVDLEWFEQFQELMAGPQRRSELPVVQEPVLAGSEEGLSQMVTPPRAEERR
ncbi:MAG: hypothetical protein LAO31_01220 [Acidobacteriia bacterium]|nr:hypothetical protein [Terriglobia bacterium]